jgi:hypothetical protein
MIFLEKVCWYISDDKLSISFDSLRGLLINTTSAGTHLIT